MDWRDRIRNPNCELCELHEEAEHVCLMGAGSRKAKIMVVGEAPGAREDEEHEAFVGPAGQLLDKTLHEAGLSRRDCYITNAAKCRPPDNRSPSRAEAKICSSTYLQQEIEKVRPEFLFLLGNVALQAVTGRSGITKHRGKTFQVGDAIALATFHPAAILRNPRFSAELRADTNRLGRMVRGEPDGVKTRVGLVTTKSQLRALLSSLRHASTTSYDIETTGLQEWVPGAAIVSIAFTFQTGQSYVVPLWHRQSPWRKNWIKVLHYLKPGLERSDCKYIAHNGKFDCRWLAQFGVFVPQTFDTMLAAHMLDENRPKSLKTLAQVILGVDAWDIGEDVKDAYNVPIRRLAIYNGKDTDYTLRLYHVFKRQLKEEPRIARVFAKLMMPASNALTKIEMVGLYADKSRIKGRLKEARRHRRKIMQTLITKHHAPEDINFNSPQQLANWLFGELHLQIVEETPKGAPSTREAVLLKLSQTHPASRLLIEYRLWTKRINTYLEPWLEAAKLDKRSRLHTGYKLFGTVTGRLSAEGGHGHTVPREPFMRTCLGAPPGWKFVEADFSQIELRIAAMLAGERRMLRAFATGQDIHLQTATEGTRKAPNEITKEERKLAKGVNFGLLYGMGWRSLIEYLFEKFDLVINESEAQAWHSRFFESYPQLVAWHQRQRRLAHRYQRVASPIGRVRHLPDVRSGNREVVAEAERQSINSPVQSLASDLMLLALTRLSADLPGRDARIVGTVHDSILLEVREGALGSVVPLVKSIMEDTSVVRKKFGADISVPIEAECSVGQYWGDPKAEVWE